jgi:hypothetical protein
MIEAVGITIIVLMIHYANKIMDWLRDLDDYENHGD